MSVLDAFSAGAAPPDTLPKADQPLPKTGFFSNLSAGYTAGFAGPSETNLHQNLYERPYYDQVVAALNARGERTTDPLTQVGGRSSEREYRNPISGNVPLVSADSPLAWAARENDTIWQAVQRIRQSDPKFLADLDSPSAIAARAQADRQRDLAQANSVNSQASTLGSIGYFLGGIASAPFEPSSYVGGGVGGIVEGAAGKTIGRQILKSAVTEGAVNAGAATMALPFQANEARTNLNQEMTAGEAVKSVAEQAAFGAVLGGAHVAVPELARRGAKGASEAFDAAISKLPPSARAAVMGAALRAGTVQDRALSLWAREGLGVGTEHSIATPDEVAALHVMERDADVREASPFPSAPRPDGAHNNRLAAVMQSLDMEERPPTPVPSPAPMPASSGLSEMDRRKLPPAPVAVADRIIQAESGGKAGAHNPVPGQTASGLGQFTDRTWRGVAAAHPELIPAGADVMALKNDPVVGRAMTHALVADNAVALRRAGLEDSAGNIYLAHFLGADGAARALKAAPDTPIRNIVGDAAVQANAKILEGKTTADVIAWAHKKMGDATGEPVGRPDAIGGVDPGDVIPETMPTYETAQFRPDEIETDAGLMQYKSGGDAAGVTDRLQGVTEWNPILSGKAVVWEDLAGRRVIVDGHQRLGLAQRLAGTDPNIRLDAVVLREADGITAQQARVWGALKNIAEGSGDAVDAARVLREAPPGFQLPPRSPLVRTAKGLSNLSNEAFGAVLNNAAQPNLAAQVGNLAPGRPDLHMSLLDMIRQSGVTTEGEAATVIRQAMADGFGTRREEQLGMFGDMPQQSLYGPAARILDAAKRQLRQEKRTFATLTDQAGRIEAAGNVLDRASNQAKVIGNDEALAILDRTANSAGPVRSALLDAARASLDGDQRAATRQFLDALSGIDLRDAARGVDESGAGGNALGGGGRALDAPEADGELADGRGLSGGPTAYDDAASAGHASLGFSEPITGPAVDRQIQSLEHDLRMVVYHGSPHTFERFSTSHIGTGEGAQAFGHGLYFTDNPALAEKYRRDLTKIYDAKHDIIDYWVQEAGGDWKKASDLYEAYAKDVGINPGDIGEALQAGPAGKVYNVSIPQGAKYLLWDRPFEDQPPMIANALRRELGDDASSLQGEALYDALTKKLGSAEKASNYLHEAGATGIKYLAGDSRRKGEGNFNYVVFNDQDVRSFEQGEPPAAAPEEGPLGTFRLTEDGPERTFGDILKSADEDLSAVDKARACMAPPKAEA